MVATRISPIPGPSGYVLVPLRESAEFTLYRGRKHDDPSPVLAIALSTEQPSPQSIRRLEHEYSFAAELIPRGRPSLWLSLVTKGGRSSYSRTLAVSRWIGFLSGSRGNRST